MNKINKLKSTSTSNGHADDSSNKKSRNFCSKRKSFAAIAYARRGWAVLPLHTIKDGICSCLKGANCTSAGKHPLLPGGVNKATASIDEVKRLWQKHPDANIGIATGKISGIVALDVDPRNGGKESLVRLRQENGLASKTATTHTGGDGYHFLFSYPEGGLPTSHRSDQLSGLDMQSDGAYIVAPPSNHISGKTYRWRRDRDPGSQKLARLPETWLARFQKSTTTSLPLREAAGGISEGGRNSYLTSRAGALRHSNLSPEAILAALKVENAQHCNPPLDDDEVTGIANSVCRYPAGQISSRDEAEGVMQIVLNQHFSSGKHLLHAADGKFWEFDGTRWASISNKKLSGIVLNEIQSILNRRGQSTSSLMQQVIRLLEAKVSTDGDPLRFLAAPAPVINCKNGELWINANGSLDLRPHSATSYLRHRLDVDYDPSAKCPRYNKAVTEIFGKAEHPVEMAKFWDELIGYTIQPDRRMPLVVLGWGSGNNGKTRLLETFVRLVGHDLITAMPIGDLEKSRFATGSLLGKIALIDDDVKSGTRLPDGHLKKLSEEKTLTGENKYGPSFTFTARTAIFMLFNNPPSLADLSYGLQRRLVVVRFDRCFTPEETDPGLFRAIWDTELPGVLNRYLAGLQRFIARGWTFAPPIPVEAAKADLLKAANPLPAFIAERCEKTGSALVRDVYDAYGVWTKDAGITFPQQRTAFSRNLVSLNFQVRHSNKGDKVVGLRLRSRPQ